jgi:hypothetical protein
MRSFSLFSARAGNHKNFVRYPNLLRARLRKNVDPFGHVFFVLKLIRPTFSCMILMIQGIKEGTKRKEIDANINHSCPTFRSSANAKAFMNIANGRKTNDAAALNAIQHYVRVANPFVER